MSWVCTPKAPDVYDVKQRRTKDVPDNETDVNKIVDRFMKTGHVPSDTKVPAFADVTPYAEGLLKTHAHIANMAHESKKLHQAEGAAYAAAKAAAAKPPVVPPQTEEKGGKT